MRRALHAEWTKLRTVAETGWLLAALVGLTAATSAAASWAVSCTATGCGHDAARISLAGVQLGQAVVVVLAALAIGAEHRTGMLRITFTAMPRRSVVLAAKATVLVGLTVAAGAAAVLASLLLGRLILPGNGFTAAHDAVLASPLDGPMLRASVGSVLYLALIALLSLGVVTAVREPAAAVGIVLGLLYLVPALVNLLSDADVQRRLTQLSPADAGLSVQATTGLADLPLRPWAGLGVLAAWAAAALLGGGLLLRLRDA